MIQQRQSQTKLRQHELCFPNTDSFRPKTTHLTWDVVIVIEDEFLHTLGIKYANLVVCSTKKVSKMVCYGHIGEVTSLCIKLGISNKRGIKGTKLLPVHPTQGFLNHFHVI